MWGRKINRNHQQLQISRDDQINVSLMRDLGRYFLRVFVSTLRPCRDNSLKASVMHWVFLSRQLPPTSLSSFFPSHSFDVLPPNLPWAVDLTESEDTASPNHSAEAAHSHGRESVRVCLRLLCTGQCKGLRHLTLKRHIYIFWLGCLAIHNRFSITFRSEDWCLGSLSCWRVHCLVRFSFLTGRRRLCFEIIRPSTFCRHTPHKHQRAAR